MLSSIDLLTTKHLAVITDLGSGIEMIVNTNVETIRNDYGRKHKTFELC